MRFKEKLLAIFLSICMIFGMLPTTAFAETTSGKNAFTATATTVKAGDTFDVSFTQQGTVEGIDGVQLQFSFDTNAFEVMAVNSIEMDKGDTAMVSTREEGNRNGFVSTLITSKSSDPDMTMQDGTKILSTTFKVKDNITPGKYAVKIKSYILSSTDEKGLPLDKTPSDYGVTSIDIEVQGSSTQQDITDTMKVAFTNKAMPYGDRYEKVPETTVTAGDVTLVKDTDYTVEGAGNYKNNGGWPYVAGNDCTVKISPVEGSKYTFTAKEYSFKAESNKDTLTIAYKDGQTLSKDYDGTPVAIEYNANAVLSANNTDPLKTMTITNARASKGGQFVYVDGSGSANKVVWTFYTDKDTTKKTTTADGAAEEGGAPSKVGDYWVKASIAADNAKIWTAAESNALAFTINKSDIDNEAIADVIDKIDAIGEVTLDSEDAITEARTAYDKLSDASKAKVTNYSVLTAAEAALKELQKNDTITCYVRAEGNDGTVLPLTKVTMNKHEVPSFSSYAIKNGPDDQSYITALHILLQALTDRGMTDELATVDIGSSGWITDMFGWGMDQMWCVRGIDAPVVSGQYEAKDGETYVFYQAYGNWGAGYGYTGYGFFGEFGPGQDWTPHSAIETTEMTKEVGETADFKYLYTSSMHTPQYGPCNNEDGATTLVYVGKNDAETVTDEDYREDIQVDKEGKFQLTFDQPGTYIVSARYYNPDSTRGASNAYCKVTVKDSYGVLDLINKIDAIGTVTVDSENAIAEARTAYDALPEEVKARVTNYDTLTAAETALQKLNDQIISVIDQIDAIGEVTLDSEEAINDARTAYDKLSDTQKAKVTNYSVLTAAEAALKELWKDDNITCYVRAEGDDGTVLPLTKVTMNKHEVPSFSSYAIKNGPDDKSYVSALHILLQALTDRGMTDELATVDIASSGWITDMFGWGMDQLWCLNGIDAPTMSCNYQAKDGETYVFYQAYGNWGAGYGYTGYGFFGEFGPGQDYTPKSAIETTEMTKEVGETADFKYLFTSSMHSPDQYGPCNNENGNTVKVYVGQDGAETVTNDDYREDVNVDKDGKFQLTFAQPGTYIVSARYYNPDGTRGASNAYCKVTVKDTYGVAGLMDKINNIGIVMLGSENAITEARTAYDALPEEVKARVTNYDTLTAAEAALQGLKDQVAAAMDKIDAIGTVTLESETAILEARTAYNALSDEQKEHITNIATLTAAEQRLEKLKGDAKAIADTGAAIDAIGDSVTLDSEAAIKTARAAYDGLSAENKEKIANYTKLTEAEARLAQLKADQEAAANADQKITAIGTVTLDSKKAIEEARTAYDELTEVQKQQVTKLDTLTKAEASYAELVKAEQAKVKDIEEKIDAIGKVSLNSEKAITEARDAYNALHGDYKGTVSNYDTLTAAEQKLSGLKIDKAAEETESKIDAIGKVSLNSEKAIKEARDAYDALPDAAKKKVNNYKTLTDAEKQLADLKAAVNGNGKTNTSQKNNTNTTSTKNKNTTTASSQKTAAKTGDTTNVMLPISLMLLAVVAAGLCLTVMSRRRKRS